MDKTTVTIKNVEEQIYLKFRAVCIEKKLTAGNAATEAFKEWLARKGVIV